MARRRLIAALVAGIAGLLQGLPARADDVAIAAEPTRVEIVLPTCAPGPFDADAFVRLLTVELRDEGVTRLDVVDARTATSKDTALARVTVSATPCSETASQIELTVDDAMTNKAVVRTVGVGDIVREARPRALALAIAELVRASWAELALPNAPSPGVPISERFRRLVQLHAPLSPPPPAADPHRSVALSVAIAARVFPTYATATLGPRVALSVAPSTSVPVRVRLDANLLFGTSYDPLGELPLGLATGGAAILLGRASNAFDVEVGPHLEVGWGWVSGEGAAAGTQTSSGGGVVVDASVAFEARFALGAAFWAALDLDAGAVLRSLEARADGRVAAGFGGPVVGMALGLARTF